MPVTRSKGRKVTPGDVARLYCMSKSDPRHVLKKYIDPWIGYGLFASQDIMKGDFIVEYRGSLIFEEHLQSDSCFHYYFTYKGKSLCIDASNVECLAKYANDSYERGNSSMKVLEYNNRPHLCLFATKHIKVEDEILYDYGVQDTPWRIRQNKNWPHRLTECDGVDSCSLCDNPLSSAEWNGFSCFDCGDMWHESCFKKISADERCCMKKKKEKDMLEKDVSSDVLMNSATSCQDMVDPTRAEAQLRLLTTQSSERFPNSTSHHPTFKSSEYSNPDSQDMLKEDVTSDVLINSATSCQDMVDPTRAEAQLTLSTTQSSERFPNSTSHHPTSKSSEYSNPDSQDMLEKEFTSDVLMNSATSCQDMVDPTRAETQLPLSTTQSSERFPNSTSHHPTSKSSEYSNPDSQVVETEITGDPLVNSATSGQDKEDLTVAEAKLALSITQSHSCDRFSENTSHDPTDKSLECPCPDDLHPTEVNQQELKQDSSMLSKSECSKNRSAMLMLLAMSQPVTSSEQQNIPPPPNSPNPFEDEDLVRLCQRTVVSDPDKEVSQSKTQPLERSTECDSSINTFHGLYKSLDDCASDASDVFPVCKMPPEYPNQPSTSTAGTVHNPFEWSERDSSSSESDYESDSRNDADYTYNPSESSDSDESIKICLVQENTAQRSEGDFNYSGNGTVQNPTENNNSNKYASCSGEGQLVQSKAISSQASSDASVIGKTAQTYKKPYRLCPFCNTAQSKLSLHIATQHKDEKCVADAIALPKKEKAVVMSSFKKMGILKVNKEQAKGDNPAYERERSAKGNTDLVMCCHCNGFYSKPYMKRHTKTCQGDSSMPSVPVPIHLFSIDEESSTEFATEILAKFRRDEIGIQCTKDPVLLLIGRRLWFKEKRKVDKKVEVRRSVMSDLRRLSSLYLELVKQEEELGKLPERNGNASDLFQRSNFAYLEGAIECYTSVEKNGTKDVKAGLKNALYYLLKSAAKILKASYLIDDKDDEAAKIDKFVAVLELNYNYLFGDAVYKTLQQRQVKLRRPEALPQEEDLKELRCYIIENMSKLSSDTAAADIHHFVLLRDLVVCRLTLFNARRGGEPARLLIREWKDAERGAWLDANRLENLEELDRTLASSLSITYQSGKGSKHLVPVLFPSDTLEPIRKLSSKEWRSAASINRDNPYLFPSTNGSENHVSGWHSVYQCCEKLNLRDPTLITATKNRHRISTLFALMDVPESEREYFYKHLGHSKETNCNIYQAPLAIKEMTVVGRRLQTIDEGDTDELSSQDESSPMSNFSSPDTSSATDESCVTDGEGCNETVRKAASCRLDVSKARRYTIWSREESDAVQTFFRDYYNGEAVKKLPGKKEITEFLKAYPAFSKDWKVIHTKVMNDIRLQAKRASNRENGWVSGSR